MVSRALRRRAEQLRAVIPMGCEACRSWPVVWVVGEGDPEPPMACGRCGRLWSGLCRVYVGVRLADV